MNNLSLLIYLIGVVDALRNVAIGALILGGISFILGVIFLPLMLDGIEEDLRPTVMKMVKWSVVVFFAAVLLFVVLPSRQTLLLIAGNEIGRTETVQSVVQPGLELLKSWIEAETDKLKKKESK